MGGDMNTADATVRVLNDGPTVLAAHGGSLLEAAQKTGVEVPTLCHHVDLLHDGFCRLCLVDVAGESSVAARDWYWLTFTSRATPTQTI